MPEDVCGGAALLGAGSWSAEGKETWSMRFLAAAMARRAKEAIRRASASRHFRRGITASPAENRTALKHFSFSVELIDKPGPQGERGRCPGHRPIGTVLAGWMPLIQRSRSAVYTVSASPQYLSTDSGRGIQRRRRFAVKPLSSPSRADRSRTSWPRLCRSLYTLAARRPTK